MNKYNKLIEDMKSELKEINDISLKFQNKPLSEDFIRGFIMGYDKDKEFIPSYTEDFIKEVLK